MFSDVLGADKAVEIVDEMQHLFVALLIIVWDDWDAIIDVEGEGEDRIVNYHDLWQGKLRVREDAQILYVVSFGRLDAVLAVEAVLDELVIWVYVIENGVRVHLMTCREYNYLIVFASFLEALHDIRSNIDACIHGLLVWEIDFQNHIGLLFFYIVDAMDQSFIHVENC